MQLLKSLTQPINKTVEAVYKDTQNLLEKQ